MKPTKHSKNKNTQKPKKYVYLLFKLLVFIILFKIVSIYKAFIIVLIFEVFDFFKTVLKQTIPYSPIDFEFIFGITVSYYYNPLFGVLIFFLSVINRTLLSCIEIRHITKSLRHVPLYFLITLFRGINFFWAAMIMLVLNYVLKYLFNFIKGDFSLSKTSFNVINFLMSTISFYLIYSIYYYFPFLA